MTKTCFLKSDCNDGTIDEDEFCDDGAGLTCKSDCTGCEVGYVYKASTKTCIASTGNCGTGGELEDGEVCDDDDGGACNDDCTGCNSGYTLEGTTCMPICGDSDPTDPGEVCDDGDGDACQSDC